MMPRTEYVVRRWYNDWCYDGDGILSHMDEVFDEYERAKWAYASALECCEDARSVELIRRREGWFDFTMASSDRREPRRIVIEEEWLPEPGEDD